MAWVMMPRLVWMLAVAKELAARLWMSSGLYSCPRPSLEKVGTVESRSDSKDVCSDCRKNSKLLVDLKMPLGYGAD